MRALERGLEVLLALGRLRSATVVALAQTTGLPRPTLYRLLETLQAAGMVARNGSEQYRLTQRVRALGDGYDEEDWITGVARPVLAALGEAVAWPTSLFTFDAGRMLVRETTHHQSALSLDHGMVGQRLPMLRTAAGRAYLAFCPAKERSAIVLLLASSDDPDDRGIRDWRRVADVIRAARADGHATQHGEINRRTASFSMPIVMPGPSARVLGCISVIWIAGASTTDQVVQRCGGHVRQAAAQIAAACDMAAQDKQGGGSHSHA